MSSQAETDNEPDANTWDVNSPDATLSDLSVSDVTASDATDNKLFKEDQKTDEPVGAVDLSRDEVLIEGYISLADKERGNELYEQRMSEQLWKLYPVELAHIQYMRRHVRYAYENIVGCWQQFTDDEVQLSGSLADLVNIDDVVHSETGQLLCESNLDVLKIYRPLVYTSPTQAFQRLAEQPKTKILVIDTTGCSPGYTRIKDIMSDKYVAANILPSEQIFTGNMQPISSSSYASTLSFNYNQDLVNAYRCSEWDDSISSLFKRENKNWPTSQLLEDLRNTSVLLVHKIDPIRKHENLQQYFRFSFSVVEKVLVNSLPLCFRYVYLCTKLMLKFYAKETALKSYYLKTVCFYFLAENFQNQTKFTESPYLGVLMLIERLRSRFLLGELANFFIPEMNLLQEIDAGDRDLVVDVLSGVLHAAENKLSDLASQVTVIDYRPRDNAVAAATEALDIMAQALHHQGDQRKQLMRQAEKLLEEANEMAPITADFTFVAWILLHFYLLDEELLHKAVKIRKHPNDLENKSLFALKLTKLHAPLFWPVMSKALSFTKQPIYLMCSDYLLYLHVRFNEQIMPLTEFVKFCRAFHDEHISNLFFYNVIYYHQEILMSQMTERQLAYYGCMFAYFFDIFSYYSAQYQRFAAHMHDLCWSQLNVPSSSLLGSDGEYKLQEEDHELKDILSCTDVDILHDRFREVDRGLKGDESDTELY